MQSFIIKGPAKLEGEVKVSGSKNAALPMITALLLADGKSTLKNVPDIKDIRNLIEIVRGLGCKVAFEDNTLTIDTTGLKSYKPNPKLVRNLRASIVLMGSLLARFGKVEMPKPGGCFIGSRPIDVHLKALKQLGAKVIQEEEIYRIECPKLIGNKITLGIISVTGTENILEAAVLADGETEIRLAAIEPHVVDFCSLLKEMGAKIEGIGTHNLRIKGVEKLNPVEYTVIPDQIEAGTFAIAGIASRGQLTVHDFLPEHHESFLNKLDEMGASYKLEDNRFITKASKSLRAANVKTEILDRKSVV